MEPQLYRVVGHEKTFLYYSTWPLIAMLNYFNIN